MKALYTVKVQKSVLKDLRRIPEVVLQRIETALRGLSTEPVPMESEKIQGYDHYYRIRIADYRIIYEVAKEIRIITIIRVRHQRDVYKNM